MSPISIEVTEEQNREWHRDNLRAARARVKEVKRLNAERLRLAEQDVREAEDWARSEGVDPDTQEPTR